MNTAGHRIRVNADNVITYGVLPVTFLFGSVGNVISLRILTARKFNFLKTSVGVYLTALAFADVNVTCVYVPVLFVRIYFDQLVLSHGFCKAYEILGSGAISTSNMLLTLMTFDRYLVVRFPLKAKSICRPRKASKIISVLLVVQALRLVPQGVLSGVGDNARGLDCFSRYDPTIPAIYEQIFTVLSNAIFSLILPVFFTIGANLAMIYSLQSQRSEIKHKLSTQSKDSSLNFLVLVISVVLVLTHLPRLIYYFHIWAYDVFRYMGGATLYFFEHVLYYCSESLILTNSAVNFYVYCLSSRRFRVGAKSLFCRR
ncbi:neurotensin receptor type 1-like [Tubulanus polymorphus]|uniref:neurotensin receptor type 1-like n=1 Tax=Tubulanus polymorphus TaxID=672921 RepID=UPI003DA2D6E4